MECTTQFALPSQGTRLGELEPYAATARCQTGLSPSVAPVTKGLTPARPLESFLDATNQDIRPDFRHELFPVRSPLLGESRLVSIPLLTNMLKFSR